MDSCQDRPRRRPIKPAIQDLESRCLLAGSLPDIALVSVTTTDSRKVIVDYDVKGVAVNQPIHFEVERSASAQSGADAQAIGGSDVLPAGSSGQTLDLNGQVATAQGHHKIEIALPGGLPPTPQRPYVRVVADPDGVVPEVDKSNNTAALRTYTIGVITHGGVQPKEWKTGPPWERRMAEQLKADGYDAVIPYNWVAESNHAGAAARQAPRLVNMILNAASKLPSDGPIDLHLIGHSEGAVVNSQAIELLNRTGRWTPALSQGFLKMTMLDPHAANNGVPAQQYSVSNGLLGRIARAEINKFQSKAKDPVVSVPPNVQDAEVFFQHTPIRLAGGSNRGIYNLWGQVPVHGRADYFDLTAPGISHSGKFGVQDWYRLNVVPSLGDGAPFVQSDTLSGALASETSGAGGRMSVDYAGKAAPGASIEVLAAGGGVSTLVPIGRTVAGSEGTWHLTTRPLAAGHYRVIATADAPSGPRGKPATMKPVAWLGTLAVGPQ
jgi:hypothetical protein